MSRYRDPALPDRFWSKTVTVESGCWLWTGATAGSADYGSVRGPQRRNVKAHRWAYEALTAKIPPGLVLDHLCRTPRCVNPDHLEPVTDRINTLRSPVAPAAMNAAKAHCLNGHELAPENLLAGHGSRRQCRLCKNQRQRRARDRQRAKIVASSNRTSA